MIEHLSPEKERWVNHNNFLQDSLLEMNVVADGLYQWRKFLLTAQKQDQVTPNVLKKPTSVFVGMAY